jgi:hypothetical protein
VLQLLLLLLHKGLHLRLHVCLRLDLRVRLCLRLQQRRSHHVMELSLAVELMQLAAQAVLLLLVNCSLERGRQQCALQLSGGLVGTDRPACRCSQVLLVHASRHLPKAAS